MVNEHREQYAAAHRAVARWRSRFVAQTFEVCRPRPALTPEMIRVATATYFHTGSLLNYCTLQAWASSVRDEVDERQRKQRQAASLWTNSAVARAFRVWLAEAAQRRKAVELQRRILVRMQHGIVYDVRWRRIECAYGSTHVPSAYLSALCACTLGFSRSFLCRHLLTCASARAHARMRFMSMPMPMSNSRPRFVRPVPPCVMSADLHWLGRVACG